ncbi:MAG: RluA family pseudouridine synthase [Candidatus Hydrogenedentota bacterium]|nr:MAG: RluA family pseudouridine synthase [Candidatus Hydrogenedentota bacterium]
MPETRVFVVTAAEERLRLDKVLAARFPEISRNVLARLARDGRVLVQGSPRTKAFPLREGMEVRVTFPDPDPAEGYIVPEKLPLKVLHEDDHIAVIDKPAGLCVHPAPGHPRGTLVNALLHRYPCIAGVGSLKRPGIVHRLDKDTSGLLVVALSPPAYLRLVSTIKNRNFTRAYLLVVRGVPRPRRGRIEMPITRDPLYRKRFTVAIGRNARLPSKPAVTRYRVLKEYGTTALVRAELETGRTHQIRVHMKAFGHPLVGDSLYGRGNKEFPISRQALHATYLAIRHPITGALLSFESPPPPDFQQLLEYLEKTRHGM